MRIVPISRLLIQPTVQQKWIEQHKEIEFELPEDIHLQFKIVWQTYQSSDNKTLIEFLENADIPDIELYESDHIFALLVGADHLRKTYPFFSIKFHKANLVWSIVEGQ